MSDYSLPLDERKRRLEEWAPRYFALDSLEEKLDFLNEFEEMRPFLLSHPHLEHALFDLPLEAEIAIKEVIVIGEGDPLFYLSHTLHDHYERILCLAAQLEKIDLFYTSLGGIVGYHLTLLQLLSSREKEEQKPGVSYQAPPYIDLREERQSALDAARQGLLHLPQMAEIYPIGGAGDRLGLIDPENGIPLPAALLPFGGFSSLFEGLLADLEARELLYERLTNERCVTPILLMTSHAKKNHHLIQELLDEQKWFNRPKESFRILSQPLVPVLSQEGHWIVPHPLKLLLKPGGHGALWPLMKQEGAFGWLAHQKRRWALVRQINNPLAGSNDTLMTMAGLGIQGHYQFGFASAPRRVGAAEGTLLLRCEEREEGVAYSIGNIEYTDFQRYGIADQPVSPDSPYSPFPANTNLLFIDLEAAQRMTEELPFPGALVNLKNKALAVDPEGNEKLLPSGRLETTMQNLSDGFHLLLPSEQGTPSLKELPTFILYKERGEILSVTKKLYQGGGNFADTPDQAYWDLQAQRHALLSCAGWVLPPLLPLVEGWTPSCHLLLDPRLGPLEELLLQRFQSGHLAPGASLQLLVRDCLIEHLSLEGSLIVRGKGKGRVGSAYLRNLSIRNRGVQWESPETLPWKNQLDHLECCLIEFEGEGLLIAEGVSLEGEQRIRIPAGKEVHLFEEGGKLSREEHALGKGRGGLLRLQEWEEGKEPLLCARKGRIGMME